MTTSKKIPSPLGEGQKAKRFRVRRHRSLAFLGFVFLSAMMLSSCSDTENIVIDYQHDYFPDEIGHYVIYDVDSITFSEFFGGSDTAHYQVKEVNESYFTDNQGRQAVRIERYYREDSTQPWVIADVWSSVRNTTTAEKVEENQRFVKLLFPPEEGQSWAGNQYIQIIDDNWYLEDWECTLTSLDEPLDINGLHFDSTLTVMQEEYESLIEKVDAVEKYAKHVGLVYKYFLWMEKRGDITRPWTNPENGLILTMTIRDYGPK